MPIVYEGNNPTPTILARVEDELYRDFLERTLVEGVSPAIAIQEYKNIADRKTLSDYIIHRLAEVDPGFLPAHYGQ